MIVKSNFISKINFWVLQFIFNILSNVDYSDSRYKYNSPVSLFKMHGTSHNLEMKIVNRAYSLVFRIVRTLIIKSSLYIFV
jgi:hypothetical protein